MPRPNQTAQRRKELQPILAQTFAELGYRRTTTAELSRRCGVRENILYRLWADKKAMFIAAIAYVYDSSLAIWEKLLADGGDQRAAAERLLDYESKHHGEFRQYRIVFAGLSETDDPEVRAALAGMYRRYQRFIQRQLARAASADETRMRERPDERSSVAAPPATGRDERDAATSQRDPHSAAERREATVTSSSPAESDRADSALRAWAIIGLGTVANIGRELGLLGPRERQRLFREVGRILVGEA